MMRNLPLNRDQRKTVDWRKVTHWVMNLLLNVFVFIGVLIIFGGISDFIPSVRDLASFDVNLTILGLHIALLSIVIAVSAFFGFFSLEKAIRREVEEQFRLREEKIEALITKHIETGKEPDRQITDSLNAAKNDPKSKN